MVNLSIRSALRSSRKDASKSIFHNNDKEYHYIRLFIEGFNTKWLHYLQERFTQFRI